MNFLLIHKIKVQDANAAAGFTWGFPAITHFLGFTENLDRKLKSSNGLQQIELNGCGVISHKQTEHSYIGINSKTKKPEGIRFTQSRNTAYFSETKSADKQKTPTVVEEGRMNMTVSLLIGIKGNVNIGNTELPDFIEKCCYTQRLAGGSIIGIEGIEVISDARKTRRKLLPGFALMERTDYLEEHYGKLLEDDPDAELLDAWLDYSVLKQAARPEHELISKHLKKQATDVKEAWDKHLERKPFKTEDIPTTLKSHFTDLKDSKETEKVHAQWQAYCNPVEEKTPAVWEYLSKPHSGFLVPLMAGYKAISRVYENNEVENTRDAETPVCFVEAAHTIGEWVSPHRAGDSLEDLLWHYHHEENWYLCKQGGTSTNKESQTSITSTDAF